MRMEELTDVSNALVEDRDRKEGGAPHSTLERLTLAERTIQTLTAELEGIRQLLADILNQMDRTKTSAGATPAFRSQVAKPGMTTPAAEGGPNGPSRRLK